MCNWFVCPNSTRKNQYLKRMKQVNGFLAKVKFRNYVTNKKLSHKKFVGISLGPCDFGENYVQEALPKIQALSGMSLAWHFIGHLQTNKIKYIVPFVSLIHGVDLFKLLAEIDKQAAKTGKIVNCLLQMHIAQEETKFGFSADELLEMLGVGEWQGLKNIRICGLMGIATFTDNHEQIRTEFRGLKMLFEQVKTTYFASDPSFCELSMGMSDDYQIAIEEGSTLVRVGSLIFGTRQYTSNP